MRPGRDYRAHVRKHHPEITELQMERWLVDYRHPDTDIDALVQRYVDRLETMIGLQYKGFFIKKYLKVLGVLRHHQSDKALMRYLKDPNIQTPEQLRAAMEKALIGKFREASPEVRFQGYLNRDKAILVNKGQEALIPSIETLKTIKFVKSQIEAAQAAKADEAQPAENTD